MLYNVIVLNHVSGVTLATIRLSDEGINENDGILMAGVVKAIRDFLQELKIGKIHTFQTHEKKILIAIDGVILVALVCDESTNSELYYPKIKYIASLFNRSCDWDTWCGELDIFDDIKNSISTIISLSDQELIEYLQRSVDKIINTYPGLYGFKIIYKSETIAEKYNNNIDFELKTFFESDFFNVFEKKKNDIRGVISEVMDLSTIDNSFIDYGRFSILSSKILGDSQIIFFLSGNLDPILEFNKFISDINLLEGINEIK